MPDERNGLDRLHDDLVEMRRENNAAHGSLFKRMDDGVATAAETQVVIGRLEERTKTLWRGVSAVAARVDVPGKRIGDHDKHNAEERGKTQKTAAYVGGILSAAVVALIEVLRKLSGG